MTAVFIAKSLHDFVGPSRHLYGGVQVFLFIGSMGVIEPQLIQN